MDQQRQQRRSGDDPRWPAAGRAEDAVDDRVEQASVGHDAEIEDGEEEHPRDRGDVADSRDDESPGLYRAEPADERRDRRHGDQGNQRRYPPAEDDHQQRQYRQEPEGRVHGPALERFTFGLQTERIPEERIADATEVGAEGDCHGALLEGSSRAGRGGGR
ncbi:MAG TPA: hypothetical protein VG406_02625, partial [Isosphaeraceae bacterium]|nr:hypothetical protein [Isosphaeraceae bacterium]